MNQRYRTARIAPPEPRSTFSYYGGKSKVIGRYPPPRYPLIIEPFGGAAAYAWKHREGRRVWVNDVVAAAIQAWDISQSDYTSIRSLMNESDATPARRIAAKLYGPQATAKQRERV